MLLANYREIKMVIDLSSKVYLFIPEGDAYYIRGNKYVLHVIMPQPQGSIGGADTHVLQLASQQKRVVHILR